MQYELSFNVPAIIDGVQDAITEILERSCHCGERSDFGLHGVRDGAVFSVYLCETHYNAEKRNS